MNEINPHACAEFIQATAPKFAKAKAERIYLENYLKTAKAIAMTKSDSTSLGQREADAYASKEYAITLNGLRVAVEEEERLRWLLTAAQAKLEIFKVTSFNMRQEMKQLG